MQQTLGILASGAFQSYVEAWGVAGRHLLQLLGYILIDRVVERLNTGNLGFGIVKAPVAVCSW